MRILFLSPRQCWPPRSGAKLREYYFLRALAGESELDYVYLAEPGAEPLTRTDLPFCRTVTAAPKPASYGPLQLVRGLVGRWPLPILNYTSGAMHAAVERHAGSYDIVHFDSIHMFPYETAVTPAAARFYDWHNIESESMRRYSETVGSPFRSWYGKITVRKLAALESHILKTAHGHVVCSEREREQLQRLHPQARIAVVANGVDVSYFSGDNPQVSVREPRFVFVGAMNYFPNADAAAWFVRQVWPEVRKRIPGAQLNIVGASPGPAVRALSAAEGIVVTGTVPDVRPYYQDALAAIVPLRTGGGTRLKILEAMAAGVPVISTALGAEGLKVTAGRDILLAPADEAGPWVQQMQELATSGPLRDRLRQAARELVREHYDWPILGRQLVAAYRRWQRSPAV